MPQDKPADVRQVSGKLSVLRQHPIFCDLESEAFDQLCRYAKHVTLKRGAPLFSKGDPGNSLFADEHFIARRPQCHPESDRPR